MKTTKKLMAVIMAAVMVFSLVGCGGGGASQENTDKPELIPDQMPEVEVIDTGMLKQAISDDEAMAVAYLGWCEDDLNNIEDYLTDINLDDSPYSFMLEIGDEYRVDAKGSELYCIVPKNDDDTVTVSEWLIDEYNDWQGEEGNVLYHKKNDGTPVLVKCNESEFIPNVLVTITDAKGNISRIVPCVSGMDGTLTTYLDNEDPFYDFSPYALFMPDWGEPPAWGDEWDDDDETDNDYPNPTPAPEDEVFGIDILKQAMSDYEAMAVAYLGWCEDDLTDVEDYLTAINMDNGDYSFMFEITEEYRVDAKGSELYCIVPKNDNDTVTISEWIIDEYNDWQGEEGDVLYHKKNDGNPILLKCNESEIMPNVLITITDAAGDVNRMVPCISGMDGTLTTYLDEYPFYDFSPYSRFMPGWGDPPAWGDEWDEGDDYYGDNNVFDIVYLSGDWSTTVYTDDDMYLDGSFTFDGSGNVYFAYGISGEPYSIYYEGSYYLAEDETLPDNAVILDLQLTENNTDGVQPESLYTAVTFEMSRYSDYMGMTYEAGDLLFGNEYDTYYELSYAVG